MGETEAVSSVTRVLLADRLVLLSVNSFMHVHFKIVDFGCDIEMVLPIQK